MKERILATDSDRFLVEMFSVFVYSNSILYTTIFRAASNWRLAGLWRAGSEASKIRLKISLKLKNFYREARNILSSSASNVALKKTSKLVLNFFHRVWVFNARSIGRKKRDGAENCDNRFVHFLGGHSMMKTVDFFNQTRRNSRFGNVERMFGDNELVCVHVEEFIHLK